MSADGAGPAPRVSDRLRAETAEAHGRMEAGLDLLHDLSRPRLAEVLRRFHSFHAGWEPAAARLLDDPELFDPRRRLAALDADLQSLGVDAPAEPWPVPPWLGDEGAAWGSLYVMEGSTLGGQVIGRSLRAAGVEGVTYFDGRGREAGPLWRELRRRLDVSADPARVVEGARLTFDALGEWMTGA